jgi:hypothetical protein
MPGDESDNESFWTIKLHHALDGLLDHPQHLQDWLREIDESAQQLRSLGLPAEDVATMAVPVVLSIIESKGGGEWQAFCLLARKLKAHNKSSRLTWSEVLHKLSSEWDARFGAGELTVTEEAKPVQETATDHKQASTGIPLSAFESFNPKVPEELCKADKDGTLLLDPKDIVDTLEACLAGAKAGDKAEAAKASDAATGASNGKACSCSRGGGALDSSSRTSTPRCLADPAACSLLPAPGAQHQSPYSHACVRTHTSLKTKAFKSAMTQASGAITNLWYSLSELRVLQRKSPANSQTADLEKAYEFMVQAVVSAAGACL